MNKLVLIGNLTTDVTLKTVMTARGEAKVANFGFAVNEIGDRKKTEFFNVAAWNQLGEACAKYLKKGNKAYIEGPVSQNLYVGKDGMAHASMEVTARQIQFLDPAPKQGSGNGVAAPIAPAKTQSQPALKEPTPEQDAAVFQQVDDSELTF